MKYLAVLNFNTVSVHMYEITSEEIMRLSNELETTDTEEVMLEFMADRGHRESECQYLYSDEPIEFFSNTEE